MNELVKAIQAEAWAILPTRLEGMLAAAKSGLEIKAARRSQQQQGAVAVIPVYGTITQRGGGLFEMMFGGTSAEALTSQIRAAMGEESIKAIVLDVDSPGGTVSGVQEAFESIYAMRGQKPITAVANSLMASAAYWLASAADTIVVTPSSQTGSIGVFTVHEDISAMAEKAGVKVTMISAGKYKTEGNEFEPLSDEARAAIQRRVDNYYSSFTGAVAKGRGVTPSAVRGGFGEGRVVGADEAVSLGMADRIGTLESTLAGFGVSGYSAMRAESSEELVAAIRRNADEITKTREEIAANAEWTDKAMAEGFEKAVAAIEEESGKVVGQWEVERERARWDAA
ncbi:MAG: signal peptide peptidase SppA [Acidobacteriota bacterium]|nr:signal peptide peptidase SppA [Acidobacteriota bacterium]